MQQPSDLLCNWTAASSPDMSEIDDNENDAGFGGPIARLRPNGFAGDEFDGIPEDLKHIEAFGRDSFGGMGNMNGEQSSHGNNGAPFQASSSQLQPDFRAHIKIEPQPLAAGPTGTRMGQDFRFQEAEDSSMHIHHDLMFRRIIQDIFTTCSSLCLPTDPSQWTIDHCNSWLNEMCQQFHLPTPGRLNLTGKNLMEMNVEHLVRLIPNGGDQIHAQFQLTLYRERRDIARSFAKEYVKLGDG
ncbi:unnamed protein product [Bursaphelenchus xylophilus]|uniref:(pine wood nematode) hypothetical protein n=1 Tax=Bursaphelenchus xylophilus TaxID=6326 RepID=A0A811KTN8_BURXY|nr:unnamed protein product [Bursaphelenchus xylophilus]CAG9104094.1 unnamed protein product [Bursaphelenchus xylophilus]